jgi:hypothetical protein
MALIFTIPGNIGTLLNMVGFLEWFIHGLTMLALIRLRFTMKDAKRTFKVYMQSVVLCPTNIAESVMFNGKSSCTVCSAYLKLPTVDPYLEANTKLKRKLLNMYELELHDPDMSRNDTY